LSIYLLFATSEPNFPNASINYVNNDKYHEISALRKQDMITNNKSNKSQRGCFKRNKGQKVKRQVEDLHRSSLELNKFNFCVTVNFRSLNYYILVKLTIVLPKRFLCERL